MTNAISSYQCISWRTLDSVLLLDKPIGLSSNEALLRSKRLLFAKKAGHTGTLDPLASGLLPLCFGEATKFSQHLLNADKTYEATMHLGVRTITGDAEGSTIDTRLVTCNRAEVEEALSKFIGNITQIPPMYSALKHNGKRLYQYARAGYTVERKKRNVIIRSLECLAYELPNVMFRVTCCKGTYIRTLAEDIGEALGCGAHLKVLRRISIGTLNIRFAVTLDILSNTDYATRDIFLYPVDILLSNFSRIQLDDTYAKRFLNGQHLTLSKLPQIDEKYGGLVRVYTAMQLLGVGRVINGVLRPERVISEKQVVKN
ncbi:MAG: tRNA pseudouridine(55) synthase TruB [Burkholderia sp.]|nr:tRNA pseudouridine(55) synthase TruB [Burkholderia sp.]